MIQATLEICTFQGVRPSVFGVLRRWIVPPPAHLVLPDGAQSFRPSYVIIRGDEWKSSHQWLQ